MPVLTIAKDHFYHEKHAVGSAGFLVKLVRSLPMVSPVVDEIAEENTSIIVGKVNIDKQQGLSARSNIMSIPTLPLRIIKNRLPSSRSKTKEINPAMLKKQN